MIETLDQIDRSLFIFLNGIHSEWMDVVMVTVSNKFFWIWLYALILVRIIYRYKIDSIFIIAGIIICIVLSDQITSGLMKPFFARLRPSHDDQFTSIIHLVNNYRGGMYGFSSGHAANSFGLACILLFSIGKKEKWVKYLLIWAAIVAYSRIYLGVHYPGDVLFGGIVGCLSAFVAYQMLLLIKKQIALKSKRNHL